MEEIRTRFGESPIKDLPHISILQDLKQRSVNFDSQLQGNMPVKNYFPFIFEFEGGFEHYVLHQVCCDLIWAFQQNHKMTAQTLQGVFVGQTLSEAHQETIVSAIFSFLLNKNLGLTKPIIHYAQIANILIQEGDFRLKFEDKA